MNGFFFIYFKFVKPAFLLLGLILPVMVCFCLVNKSLFDLLGIIFINIINEFMCMILKENNKRKMKNKYWNLIKIVEFEFAPKSL